MRTHFLLQAQKLFDFYTSNISSAFFSNSFDSSFTFYDDSNKASVVSIFLPILWMFYLAISFVSSAMA